MCVCVSTMFYHNKLNAKIESDSIPKLEPLPQAVRTVKHINGKDDDTTIKRERERGTS